VLVEVPVMLTVVHLVKSTRSWYEAHPLQYNRETATPGRAP
jgi:ACR3 family arsenite efflux pump ArsB